MSIYKQISEWFKECPLFNDWIFFNVIPLEPNAVSITSVQDLPFQNEFIDGSKEISLKFNLNLVKEYDANGTSDLNIDAMESFEKITEWVEDMNDTNNFPSFGDDVVVTGIEKSYTNPEVYLNEETGLARYEGQYKIIYLERK